MQSLKRLVVTLAIAAAGGVFFAVAGLPAPWLTGAAVAVGLAAIAGLSLGVPSPIRQGAILFFGTIMGAGVTPETFAQAPNWLISLGGLVCVVPAIAFTVSFYLYRFHGFDEATARLASVPGNLSYVIALAEEQPNVDKRRVAMVQIVRLTTLLILLPLIFDALGYVAVQPADRLAAREYGLGDIAVLFTAGFAGGILALIIGFPGGAITGAMLGSGILSGSGFVHVQLPDWLLLPAFILLGGMAGSNFSGTDRQFLLANLAPSLGAVLIGALIASLFAGPIALLTGMSFAQIWLAYSPGGADTMAALALALSLEPAFVAAHHVFRMLGLGAMTPIWLLLKWPAQMRQT